MFRRRADRRTGYGNGSIQVECSDSTQHQFSLEVCRVSRNVIFINLGSFLWFVSEKVNWQWITGISLSLDWDK